MFDGFQAVMGTDEVQRQEAISLLSQSTADPELRSTLLQCFRCASSQFEDSLLVGDFSAFAFYGGFAAVSPELNSDGKVSRRTILAIFEFATRGQSKLPVHGFVTAVAHLQCSLQQATQQSAGSPWVAQTKTVTSSLLQGLPALKLFVLERTQCFPFPDVFYDQCSLLMRTMWKYSEGVELVFSHYVPDGVMNIDGYERFCSDFSIFPHINRQTMNKIFQLSARNFRNTGEGKDLLDLDCFFECLARIACALLFTDTFSQYVTTVSKIVNFFETTFSSAFTSIFNVPLPTEVEELPDPILYDVSPSRITAETRRITLSGKFLGALGRGIWVSHSLATSVLHVSNVADDTAVLDISPLPLRAWDACSVVSRIDADSIPVFSISYRHQVRICVGNTPEDLALKCTTRSDLCTLTSDEIGLTLSSATNEIARKRFTEACARVPYNQNFLYENCWRHLCDTSNMTSIGFENRVALGLSPSAIEGKTNREILTVLFSTHAIVRTGDSTGRGSLTLLKYCEMLVRIALCSAPPVGEIDRAVRDILVYKAPADFQDAPESEMAPNSIKRKSVLSMSINSPSQQYGENKNLQQMIQQQRTLRTMLEKQQLDDREMRESLRTSIARLKGLLEVVLPAPDPSKKSVQAKLPAGVGDKLSTLYRTEILTACESVCSFLTKNRDESELITLECDSMKSAVLGVLVDWESVYRLKEHPSSSPGGAQRIQKLLQFRDDQAKIEEVREQLQTAIAELQEKEAASASLQAMYVHATDEKEQKSQENDRLKLVISSQKSMLNDANTTLINERNAFEQKIRNIQSENDRLIRVQRVMDDMQKKKKEDLAKVADTDFKRVVSGLDEGALRIKCFELRQQLGQELKLQEIAKESLEASKQREAAALEEIKQLQSRVQSLEGERRTMYQQLESGADSSQVSGNRKLAKRRQSDEAEGWGVDTAVDHGVGLTGVPEGNTAAVGKPRQSLSSSVRLPPGKTPSGKKITNGMVTVTNATRAFGTPRAVKSDKESPRTPKPAALVSEGGEGGMRQSEAKGEIPQHLLENVNCRDQHESRELDLTEPSLISSPDALDGAPAANPERIERQVATKIAVPADGGQAHLGSPKLHDGIGPRRQSRVTVIDDQREAPHKTTSQNKINDKKQQGFDSVGESPSALQRRSLTDSPTNMHWTTSVIVDNGGTRGDSRHDLRLNPEVLDSFASTTSSRPSMDSTPYIPQGATPLGGGGVFGSRQRSLSDDESAATQGIAQLRTHHRSNSSTTPCTKCEGYRRLLRYLAATTRNGLRELRETCRSVSKVLRANRTSMEHETAARITALQADEEEDNEPQETIVCTEAECVTVPTASAKRKHIAKDDDDEDDVAHSGGAEIDSHVVPLSAERKQELAPRVKSLQALVDSAGTRRLASMRSKLAQLDEIMKREIPIEELAPLPAADNSFMIQPETVRCVSPRIPLPSIGPKKADLIEFFKSREHISQQHAEDLSLQGITFKRHGTQQHGGTTAHRNAGSHNTVEPDPEPLRVLPPAELDSEIEYRVIFRAADGTVISVDRDTFRGGAPSKTTDDRNKRHGDAVHQLTIRETAREDVACSPIPRFNSRFEELLHLLVQESALRSVSSGTGQLIMTPFSVREEFGSTSLRPETARATADAASRVKSSRLVVHPPSTPGTAQATASLCSPMPVSVKRSPRIKIDDSKLQHMRELAKK